MPPRRWRLLVELALLLLVVGLGFALRLEPVRRAGGADFEFDQAFHLRMVRAVIEQGEVPERDLLGLPPAGKPVARLLPTWLYHLAAGWHRLRGGVPAMDICLMGALAGALIGLPLFVVARALGLGRWPALMAAAAAVVCPAHVHRTLAHWLRYDAVGSLLLISHVAALVLAVAPARRVLRIGAAVLAGLTLAAALGTWRVALAPALIECLLVLGAFVAARLRRELATALGCSLFASLAVVWTVPYLHHAPTGAYGLSRGGLLLGATAVLLVIDGVTRQRLQRLARRLPVRIGLVLLVVALAWFAGRATSYDAVSGALAAKLGGSPAAVGGTDFTPAATSLEAAEVPGALLWATTSELLSPAPQHLFDADYFALLLPLALLYPLGRLLPRHRPWLAAPSTANHRSAGEPRALWIWHGATLLCLLLTLLFARTKVLAGPLLALYPALLLVGASRVGRPGADATRATRLGVAGGLVIVAIAYFLLRLAPDLQPPLRAVAVVTLPVVALLLFIRAARRGTRLAPAALVLIAVTWTTAESVQLVGALDPRLAPPTARALDHLRRSARPGDVVLADWGRGYAVQLYTGMATVTDGLLESPTMRRRIAGYARALYAEEESILTDFCRRHDVRFVWVPGQRRQIYARYAGVRYADFFAGGRATPRGLRTNYGKLLHTPTALAHLRPVLAIGSDRIYEYVPPATSNAPPANPPGENHAGAKR